MNHKPIALLIFDNIADINAFNRLYGPKVISALRASVNDLELSAQLRMELPPSANDPLDVKEDEIPRRYAVFVKTREISDGERPAFWVYTYKRIE